MTGKVTALLVIDVQRDVLDGCFRADQVLATIQQLVAAARAAGAPVVWVQHEEPGLERGTPGWQLADGLHPRDGEPVILKSYRDAFADTDLAAELAARTVRHLVVVGSQTDYCVDSATRRATMEGFDVTLVQDGHTTTDAVTEYGTVTAEHIIGHANLRFSTLRHPGGTFAVTRAADIHW